MSKERALESLKLAKTYLDELGEKLDLLESGDKSLIEEFALSLDLALKQIQLTEENDPTVSWKNYDLNDAKWDYNFLKGDLEVFKGNYNGAISYLEQALKIIPHSLASSHIHAILSSCYWNIGNKKDAIENIKRAIELDPENKELRIEYKKELNRMISASEAISPSPLEEENDKKKSAKKSIYISIVWAVLGSICCFIYLKSEPRESPLLLFGWAYVFWATYWGWKALHGLTKKVISGITSTGCLVIIPAMQWIMICIYYIGIMIPVAAIFGSIGGGIATFLVHLKRARMSAKTLAMSFASLLIFSSILVLLTFNSRRGKIDFERPVYEKEKQASVSGAKIQERIEKGTKELEKRVSLDLSEIKGPLSLSIIEMLIQSQASDYDIASKIRDQGLGFVPDSETIEQLRKLGTGPATIDAVNERMLGLDDAKQVIPDIVQKIYSALNEGNLSEAKSWISRELAFNSQKLDTICKPFTYQAHYIESIIERPNHRFEARVRVLFQPIEESAQVLTFRVKDDSFVLESVSPYLEDWFGVWKEEAMEVARNFYYALKADRQDILDELLSSHDVLYPEFTSSFRFYPVKSYSEFQKKIQFLGAISSINAKIIHYKGLKALVHFSCESSGMARTWDIYVDNIEGEYKIVKWQYEEWTWGAHGSDPNIESYTLKRFKSGATAGISHVETPIFETERQEISVERLAVKEDLKQEIEKKKSEEEQEMTKKIEREEEKPLRAIGDIRPPKLIKRIDPIYPKEAIDAKIEGVVILEVTTNIYGRVKNVKVLRSIPLLDQAAIDAIKQWEYEPVIIKGKPRAVIFTQTIFFKFPDQ